MELDINQYTVVQVEEAPRRASLRQRGVQADGAAVDTEGRGGHITLVNGEAIRYPDPAEPAQPRERHPPSKHLPRVQATVLTALLASPAACLLHRGGTE